MTDEEWIELAREFPTSRYGYEYKLAVASREYEQELAKACGGERKMRMLMRVAGWWVRLVDAVRGRG